MAVSLIEKIARDIADALGDNFDYAFNSKPEWTAARGETKAGFRDINQPYKPDYLDAAQAALTAIMGEGDGVQEVDRAIADQYWQRDCQDHDALSQTLSEVRSTAAEAERARIVAAFRELTWSCPDDMNAALRLADAIERGEV